MFFVNIGINVRWENGFIVFLVEVFILFWGVCGKYLKNESCVFVLIFDKFMFVRIIM